jgi:hypothetical protein
MKMSLLIDQIEEAAGEHNRFPEMVIKRDPTLKNKKFVVLSNYHTDKGYDSLDDAINGAARANKMRGSRKEVFKVYDRDGFQVDKSGKRTSK